MRVETVASGNRDLKTTIESGVGPSTPVCQGCATVSTADTPMRAGGARSRTKVARLDKSSKTGVVRGKGAENGGVRTGGSNPIWTGTADRARLINNVR